MAAGGHRRPQEAPGHLCHSQSRGNASQIMPRTKKWQSVHNWSNWSVELSSEGTAFVPHGHTQAASHGVG